MWQNLKRAFGGEFIFLQNLQRHLDIVPQEISQIINIAIQNTSHVDILLSSIFGISPKYGWYLNIDLDGRNNS